MIHTIYHDSDGGVYCYDSDGNDLPYPKEWPATVGNVRIFARCRGINYRAG